MILYIDTSTSFLYSALYKDEEIIDSISLDLGRDLSSKTLGLIHEMLDKNKIAFKDIKKIIVVNGPGSFTGIRVGVTIAKTLAWSQEIPIIAISSLTAMALSSDSDDFVCPFIDARRGFYYASIYDPVNKAFIMNEQYVNIKTLIVSLESLPADFVFMGNDDIDTDYQVIPYKPNYLNIINNVKDREPTNPHLVDANYLKKTEAEEKNNDC